MDLISAVKLNVGGTRFTTSRATLFNLGKCQNFRFIQRMPGENMLTRLITHKEAGTIEVKTDEKGYIFIDRNGNIFSVILDYLRDGQLEVPTPFTCAQIRRELDYYQLPVPSCESEEVYRLLEPFRERARICFRSHEEVISKLLRASMAEGQTTHIVINNHSVVTLEYFRILSKLEEFHKKEMELWQLPTLPSSGQSRQEFQQEMLQLLQLKTDLQPQQKACQTEFIETLSTEAAREEFIRLWKREGYDLKFTGTDLEFSISKHYNF